MNSEMQIQNGSSAGAQAYHGDGLLDIFLGLGVMIATAAMLAEMPWLAGIFPAAFIPLWQDARKKMTNPRLTRYAIPTGSRRRAMMLLAGLTLAGVVGAGLGLVAWLIAANGWLPAWLGSWGKLLPAGLIGGLVLVLLVVTGLSLEGTRRYLLYAGLSAAILVTTLFLSLSLLVPMFSLGLILVSGGLVTMAQFLRNYPL